MDAIANPFVVSAMSRDATRVSVLNGFLRSTPARHTGADWPLLPSLAPGVAWVVSAALFLAALLLRLDIDALQQGYPFVTFAPSVVLTAWACGRYPAAAHAAAAALAAWWFLIRPPGVILAAPSWGDLLGIALFLAGAGVTVVVITGLADIARLALARADRQALDSAELAHRIANDMQLVGAALRQQARTAPDPVQQSALLEAARRMDGFAGLNRQDHGGATAVTLRARLASLGQEILNTGHDRRLSLDVAVDDALTLGRATTSVLGMVVSELLTNAAKHAFPGECNGSVAITVSELPGGQALLEVRDNGVGLPEDFDDRTRTSNGILILHALAHRLHGRISITAERHGPHRGTVARLTFPVSSPD